MADKLFSVLQNNWGKVAIGAGCVWGQHYVRKKYDESAKLDQIYSKAKAVGHEPLEAVSPPYRIQVIAHPHSGTGKVRGGFKEECAPIFHLAGVNCHDKPVELLETVEAEHAKEFVQELDLSSIDGICVLGGDGVFQEVVTGMMRRPDKDAVANCPIGVIPYGTSNSFVNNILEQEASDEDYLKLANACLPVVLNNRRRVDVLEITSTVDGKTIYGVSEFGWGISGVMAEESRSSSWLRSHRYWYSAFTALTEYWGSEPCRGTLSYKDLDNVWKSIDTDFANISAVKASTLGCGRIITTENLEPENGLLLLTWLPKESVPSRRDIFQLGFNMTKGMPLVDQRGVRSEYVREFELKLSGLDTRPIEKVPEQPQIAGPEFVAAPSFSGSKEGYVFKNDIHGIGYYLDTAAPKKREYDPSSASHEIPFNIDGEAIDAKPAVRVKVLPSALTVFAPPSENQKHVLDSLQTFVEEEVTAVEESWTSGIIRWASSK